jgi:hypothetical protein
MFVICGQGRVWEIDQYKTAEVILPSGRAIAIETGPAGCGVYILTNEGNVYYRDGSLYQCNIVEMYSSSDTLYFRTDTDEVIRISSALCQSSNTIPPWRLPLLQWGPRIYTEAVYQQAKYRTLTMMIFEILPLSSKELMHLRSGSLEYILSEDGCFRKVMNGFLYTAYLGPSWTHRLRRCIGLGDRFVKV